MRIFSGGLAIAVPGELRAYELAHQRFGGKLPWADLFAPTIKLCREGFVVSSSQAAAIDQNRLLILKDPTLKFVHPSGTMRNDRFSVLL